MQAGSSAQGGGFDRISGVVSARQGNSLTIEDGTLLSNDGHAFFELVGHAHRHYMVCLGCHQMFPIRKCPVEDSVDSAAEDLGFEVTDHSLVLYGYCRHCRSGRQLE